MTITRAVIYFSLLGILISDVWTHTSLDKINSTWWILFFITDIWFNAVVIKQNDL